MNSSKPICTRRMREYAALFDAAAPTYDPEILSYGTWVDGELPREDMLAFCLANLGDVTLVAARYMYIPPTVDSDPFSSGSFSAVKVYFKEKINGTSSKDSS